MNTKNMKLLSIVNKIENVQLNDSWILSWSIVQDLVEYSFNKWSYVKIDKNENRNELVFASQKSQRDLSWNNFAKNSYKEWMKTREPE